MIESVSNTAFAAFGAYSCPHCGRDGIASRHAPCPSCGQDVTVAHQLQGQGDAPQAYMTERGETKRTLADQLEEEQRRRLESEEPEKDPSRSQDPRSAAAAMEAGISAVGQDASNAPEHASGGAAESSPAAMAARAAGATEQSVQNLGEQELEALRELQQRDREVRSHEQAHISAGGDVVTGGARYTYETGPDGKQYAIGGEVSIDTSPVPGDPEATEEKAQTIRRAAMAPASPSSQDQKVAAQAAQMEAEARMEQLEERRLEEQGQPPADATGLAAAALDLGPMDTQHAQSQLAAGEESPPGPAEPEQRLAPAQLRMMEHYAQQQLAFAQQDPSTAAAAHRRVQAIG